MKPKIKIKTDLSPLKKLQRKSPELFNKAMEKGALQLLNWANNGSARESRKPPIKWGVLRGSASVFVGNKMVAVSNELTDGATPLKSYSGKNNTITIVYNTDYAHKMHEWKGGWGEATLRDGDAGNQWVTLHLQKDRNDLMKVIAEEFKKEIGKV